MKSEFNMNQIIKMVYAQYPSQKRMDVIRALKLASDSSWVSDNYLSFYHPLKHPESQWEERISLDVDGGKIFIDIMNNGSLEGIEFNINNDERFNNQ